MKRKKNLSIVLSLVLIISLLLTGCGGNQEGESKEVSSDGKEGSDIKVALVVTGLLGDKSYNDLAHEALMQAEKDFGIETKVLESTDPADWESNLVSMASSGYDLVIASSTQLQDAIEKHAPDFPDVKFGIIDGKLEGDNIISALFAQNQSSFLVGAACALFTTETDIPNVNEDKIIGFIGGMDIPVINDFLVGFEQGAEYIDPEIEVLVSYIGSFTDPLKSKELALAQFSQGADVIFNVAASGGNGILEAAQEVKKYAIGSSVNQDAIYPGHILTSELKHVDKAAYMMIESVVKGESKGGETLKLDIHNGGVGITDMAVIREELGDKFPEEIITKLEEIEKDIKDGKIIVDHYEGIED